VAPVGKSTICERRKTQTTALAAVLYEIDFYSDEPLPEPSKYRLFATPRRPKLWDSAKPTRGLPPLLENLFDKARGAPFSWETFQRSTPQTKPESDKIGGISREANTPHPI